MPSVHHHRNDKTSIKLAKVLEIPTAVTDHRDPTIEVIEAVVAVGSRHLEATRQRPAASFHLGKHLILLKNNVLSVIAGQTIRQIMRYLTH